MKDYRIQVFYDSTQSWVVVERYHDKEEATNAVQFFTNSGVRVRVETWECIAREEFEPQPQPSIPPADQNETELYLNGDAINAVNAYRQRTHKGPAIAFKALFQATGKHPIEVEE